MKLRDLRLEDAPFMVEWMSDDDLTSGLHADYSSITLPDAERFIRASQDAQHEKHYAIANDEDEYMGTVSLRNIDVEEGVAEFVVVVRRLALGKGYALHGMIEALDIAFNRMGLNSVYWRVKASNARAIRFFKKHGFNTLDQDVPLNILNKHRGETDSVWFAALRGDDYRNSALSRGTVEELDSIPAR